MINFWRDFRVGLREGVQMFFDPWIAACIAFQREFSAPSARNEPVDSPK